ncbi:hypothetical protein LXL04_022333 [Taraxacum kok-saghyz]
METATDRERHTHLPESVTQRTQEDERLKKQRSSEAANSPHTKLQIKQIHSLAAADSSHFTVNTNNLNTEINGVGAAVVRTGCGAAVVRTGVSAAVVRQGVSDLQRWGLGVQSESESLLVAAMELEDGGGMIDFELNEHNTGTRFRPNPGFYRSIRVLTDPSVFWKIGTRFARSIREQDLNSQIATALCLASVVDGAPDLDPFYLRRMLPRIEKLLKCDSFKAKAALLTFLGSVIGVGVASSPVTVKNLVTILVEFVAKSDDWSARKSTAEALEKLVVIETDLLLEYKTPCLKTFEAKKFDKVNSVRKTMNQMIEAWKAIPEVQEEVLTLPESQSSSKGIWIVYS